MSQIDIRIALWNSNGIHRHSNEIETFLALNRIDIFLITETHCTDRSYHRIRGYNTLYCNHPNNVAYGGTAIIIKSTLIYEQMENYSTDAIQACVIRVKDKNNDYLTVAAIYCRPRFALKENDFDQLLSRFGNKFIAGGDFNAKHTFWGSRLTSPKGRELFKSITKLRISPLSAGGPTYWPTDTNKTPDLLDFYLYKGINAGLLTARDLADLSSDHSPVMLIYTKTLKTLVRQGRVNYKQVKSNLQLKINPNVPLKSPDDIDEAVRNLSTVIRDEITAATQSPTSDLTSHQFSDEIRFMITEKRKQRKRWQTTRCPEEKRKFNVMCRELKETLKCGREQELTSHLSSLTADRNTDYSLWKNLKYLKKTHKARPTPVSCQ